MTTPNIPPKETERSRRHQTGPARTATPGRHHRRVAEHTRNRMRGVGPTVSTSGQPNKRLGSSPGGLQAPMSCLGSRSIHVILSSFCVVAASLAVSVGATSAVAATASSSNHVISTVSVGGAPYAVAFDPLNGDLYVVNNGEDNVSVIDGTTNTVIATIGVGGSPTDVLFDPANGDVYVSNHGDNSVSVIDGFLVVAVVDMASPSAMALDPTRDSIYVANEDLNAASNTVSVISGATNTVTATVQVGAAPDAMAFDPGRRRRLCGQLGR